LANAVPGSPFDSTNENPFKDSADNLAKGHEAAERIKELAADGKLPSPEETQDIMDGITKNKAGSDLIDENPFADSPFKRGDRDRSSMGRGGSGLGKSPADFGGNDSSSRIKRLINQISNSNGSAKQNALQDLAKIDPPADVQDETRQAVIKMLNEMALDDDVFTQKEAIKALGKWGDKSSAEALLHLLLADLRARSLNKEIYYALGQLKDPKSAMVIAERLGDFFDRDAAEACLREMGPIAEEALILVAPSSNAEISLRAVKLLGDVGTEACMATLRSAMRSRNQAVKEAAKMAMRKVRLRQNNTADDEEEGAEDK
jgi:HEAT repeat protein